MIVFCDDSLSEALFLSFMRQKALSFLIVKLAGGIKLKLNLLRKLE